MLEGNEEEVEVVRDNSAGAMREVKLFFKDNLSDKSTIGGQYGTIVICTKYISFPLLTQKFIPSSH